MFYSDWLFGGLALKQDKFTKYNWQYYPGTIATVYDQLYTINRDDVNKF